MIIQGNVTQVLAPHFTDDYGNSHQWVTVQTGAGPIVGSKASKKELTQNFVNQQVEWEMVSMTDGQGQPYNKFKRPPQQFQQQAAQVQTAINQGAQAYQQPRQAPQQPAQRPNARQRVDNTPDWDAIAEGKVRHGVVCAYIAAGVEPDVATCRYWTEFIVTGNAPLPPAHNDPEF